MLFKAEGKVQKDRVIMRETDTRMAKYSRRGLIINMLAYLLCLSLGDMHLVAPTAAVVLTSGLIVTVLIRAYFLLRFETLYARGPARWRSQFFISTLLGAAWWSVILSTLTLILGMRSETPILWLYTVIFFSTTVHATSPFRKFSRIYVALALFPPTIAAFYSGGFDGYMYAVMMLVFVLTLDHQAELLSTTYWQRLQSNHELRQKARALEVQMRKVDASVNLNTQFLKSLTAELEASFQPLQKLATTIGSLCQRPEAHESGSQEADIQDSRVRESNMRESDAQASDTQETTAQTPQLAEVVANAESSLQKQHLLLSNIKTFTQINSREVELEEEVFPLRPLLEQWVEEFHKDAIQHHIELTYRIHPEYPESAKGDPKAIARIFANLLGNAIRYSERGEIFIDFDFRICKDSVGYLEITIIDKGIKKGMEEGLDMERFLSASRFSGLWFPICKALAERLGGSVETDHDEKEIQYLFRSPLTLLDTELEE